MELRGSEAWEQETSAADSEGHSDNPLALLLHHHCFGHLRSSVVCRGAGLQMMFGDWRGVGMGLWLKIYAYHPWPHIWRQVVL